MRNKRTISLAAGLLLAALLAACGAQGALRQIGASRSEVGYDVWVEDGYAYLTSNDGLTIWDVHKPSRPKKVGQVTAGTSFGVTVAQGLVYMAGGDGLVIADVHDPANPKKLAVYRTVDSGVQVRTAGSTVYVTTLRGLEILDASDPGAPRLLATLGDGEQRRGLAVADGLVYLANPSRGLEVIDVADPAHPTKLTTVRGTEGAWDVHVAGAQVYVGCHGGGVRILDRSDPRSPRVVGRFSDDDGGEAQGVWGDGERVVVADNYRVEVLDIADPAHPVQIAEYSRASAAHDLDVEGGVVYVAEGRRGLLILQFER